ncbi:hypothetical protein Sipo7851_24110, partial [Streptomyces ipomoeae]
VQPESASGSGRGAGRRVLGGRRTGGPGGAVTGPGGAGRCLAGRGGAGPGVVAPRTARAVRGGRLAVPGGVASGAGRIGSRSWAVWALAGGHPIRERSTGRRT